MVAFCIDHLQRDTVVIVLFGTIAFGTWVWGAAPERLSTLVIVGEWITDHAFHSMADDVVSIARVEAHLGIAIIAGLVLTGIAVRANRIYTLAIAALQAVAIANYIACLIDPDISLRLYRTLETSPIYLQLAVLAIGTWFHARRVSKAGPYPSWARRPHGPQRLSQPFD